MPSQPVVASHQRVWAHRLGTVAPEGHVPAVMNKIRAWAARSQMLNCCPERLQRWNWLWTAEACGCKFGLVGDFSPFLNLRVYPVFMMPLHLSGLTFQPTTWRAHCLLMNHAQSLAHAYLTGHDFYISKRLWTLLWNSLLRPLRQLRWHGCILRGQNLEGWQQVCVSTVEVGGGVFSLHPPRFCWNQLTIVNKAKQTDTCTGPSLPRQPCSPGFDNCSHREEIRCLEQRGWN